MEKMVESKMIQEVHVCYAYKTKNTEQLRVCKELLQQVVSNISRSKFENFDLKLKSADEIGIADFIIGDPSHPDFKHDINEKNRIRSLPSIILLVNDEWGEDVNSILRNPLYDVRGIFRASRIMNENKDADEYGKFSEVIKNLLRQFLRSNGLTEEDFTKNIDWKVKVQSNCGIEFMSLFSTSSMQKMSAKYKDALLNLDDPLLKKLRDKLDKTENLEKRCKDIKNFFEKNLPDYKNSFHVPSLLLLGETGCGKTLLANIAANVIMPNLELSKINIASYDSSSIDSMLFGAEKGSYTSSDKDRLGIFIGHCGEVVFLDEIGDMDLESQTRLLTYMDNAQVLPRGKLESVCAPCILIAATNRDVRNDPNFRKDILNRFEHVIKIPSLRERKQDIRLLISMLLQNDKINPVVNSNRKIQRISLDAIKYLEERDYSGNFRELKFCLSQAVNEAFSEGSVCLCLRHFINN